MKLNTRRRIFYVFLLLFVVTSVAVVLYAEGWRLDLGTGQAEKAGGIYIRSYPFDAQITLDGKPIENQSAFLSRGTFISGLFPKTFTVQLKKQGYEAWTEQAQVVPSLVSEMKYAVLIPQSGMDVASGQNVKAFFEVNGIIITENQSGIITWGNTLIGTGDIVSHSTNLKTAIIRASSTRTNIAIYRFYDFQNATSNNLNPLLQQLGITPTTNLNIFIDPYNDTTIFVQTNTKIFSINSQTEKVTNIETAPFGWTIGTPIAVSPSVMAWARHDKTKNLSQVIVYDKFFNDVNDDTLIIPGTIKQLTWVKNNELGIVEDNNSLYLYSNQQLNKLADDVKHFYPTTDGNTIAVLEYHSLEIFAFSTSDYYRFNLPKTNDIQGLMWYKDMTHLFITYPDRIAFLDLVDTNLKNFITVSSGTMPSYDEQENSFYLIDPGQKLLRFDFPN